MSYEIEFWADAPAGSHPQEADLWKQPWHLILKLEEVILSEGAHPTKRYSAEAGTLF